MTKLPPQVNLFEVTPINLNSKSSQKEADKASFDLLDILSSPVLTHQEQWKDSIPERLLKSIKIARVIAGMKHEEMATYEEVAAFIMTRTYDAPMDHHWSEIYFYVCKKVMDRNGWGEGIDWEGIRPPKELDSYQKMLLKNLRLWIYERRRKILKERLRSEEKE